MKKKIANAVYWGFRFSGAVTGDLMSMVSLSLLGVAFIFDWRLGFGIVGCLAAIALLTSGIFYLYEWAKANRE